MHLQVQTQITNQTLQDDILDPANGEAQVQVEAPSPALASSAGGGEDAPQGVGSSSAEERLAPAIDDAPAGAQVPIDNYDVDRSKLALHGADGSRCGCELCKVVKQRRHSAKSGSRPHAESKIRRINGAHLIPLGKLLPILIL